MLRGAIASLFVKYGVLRKTFRSRSLKPHSWFLLINVYPFIHYPHYINGIHAFELVSYLGAHIAIKPMLWSEFNVVSI